MMKEIYLFTLLMDSSKRCSPSQNGQFDLVVVVPVPCSKLPGHFVAKQTAGFHSIYSQAQFTKSI